jgi:hypothetical protein
LKKWLSYKIDKFVREEDELGVEDNDVFDELLITAKNSDKELSLIAIGVPVVVKVNPRIKITTLDHSEPVFFNSFKSIDSLKNQSKYFLNT